jgi:hypothetical protein
MNVDEMGGTCGTYGGKRNKQRNLVREYVGKNYLEDLGRDNIGKKHKEMGWKRAEWINLVQDTDMWWAFVNTVRNTGLP